MRDCPEQPYRSLRRSQAESAAGQRITQRFRRGAVTSIHELELKNYSEGIRGQRGVFDLKAGFQNGDALVEVHSSG